VYRERERFETARTVALMLREDADDVSALTNTVQLGSVNQGQQNGNNITNNGSNTSISGVTRNIGQVTLDNIGQGFSRDRLITSSRRESRNLSSLHQGDTNKVQIADCRIELDFHADTCGVNHVARFLEYYGQVVEVSGFSDTMQRLKDIPIVKAAVAYDNPQTGETVIVIINQALYFSSHLSHMLLNANQMRAYGIIWLMIYRLTCPPSHHTLLSYQMKM
jgi:hypothetical protein